MVLAVRSSYEQVIIPNEVRERAVSVTHDGFAGQEYDATRTFFVYYGLELPSTPLLEPEFRNPLFLKTLCRGLRAKGERRLPRGFHGITATFELYLDVINERLSSELSFNPRTPLVRKALESFAEALVEAGERWLPLTKAEAVVNALLPGREFDRSLYRGLVAEGVLVEDAAWRQEMSREDIVFVAYDRFADHLVAKHLLDAHMNPQTPDNAFVQDGPLWFLCDSKQYVAAGLLEALCVQIPERTGQELIELAPAVEARWDIGDAFRNSLIWRDADAFSDSTGEILNRLTRTEYDWDRALDMLVAVATLPGHPLNAEFLDRRLRQDPMPERDSWWSTCLHGAWQSQGAVDRLVDWASSVTARDSLDDETVDLCSTTLAWMLTTANRFLRDRATQALVSLLTGRLGAVARLIERFADVDDPYVAERVYAVAYGTAMRSQDTAEIGGLAMCVYRRVFATGAPPPHILLRDYARGVVERALHLGANIDVVADRIRPPYHSSWPTIPTEEDIQPLLPDWSRGSHDSGDLEWARNRIGMSVLDDDFARYVIGTNSASTNWLSLQLDEPLWQSPDERLAALLEGFSDEERAAWEEFRAAEDAAARLFAQEWIWAPRRGAQTEEPIDAELEARELEKAASQDADLASAEQARDAAFVILESVLTEEHLHGLENVLAAKKNNDDRHPPRFDFRLIQRYILWRVFDLGWTIERFGRFDRYFVGYRGRQAAKAERIGKKYQWIAYHEVMAFVADHFQYRERFRETEGDHSYLGPWQDHFRDIDPSCTLRATKGGTSWEGHSPAWWGSAVYENWSMPLDHLEWVKRYDDLPRLEDLMRVERPADRSQWLNIQGYFQWNQQPPVDRESMDVDRRELWFDCTGYLVRCEDADAFMEWAEGVDFWGRWMPDPPKVYRMFLGEHGWSPASNYFQQEVFGDGGWTRPDRDCPVSVRTIAFEYLREDGGFDCSVDRGFTLRLPGCDLVISGSGLRWSGNDADFIDADGRLAAFDPTVREDGASALLVREDWLREFLERQGLTLCWAVLGGKHVFGAGFTPERRASLRLTGAYLLGPEGPTGFVKCLIEDDSTRDEKPPPLPVVILRTPQ